MKRASERSGGARIADRTGDGSRSDSNRRRAWRLRLAAAARARPARPLAVALLLVVAAPTLPARAGTPMPAGYPGRGRIGIEVQPMTSELRAFFGAPPSAGILIVRVEEGRPAEAAGLAVGDVVIDAAGEPLVQPRDLVAIVARAPGGEPLALTVVRARQTLPIEVVPDGEAASADALDRWHRQLGAPPTAVAADPAPAPAPGAVEGTATGFAPAPAGAAAAPEAAPAPDADPHPTPP